ncbi:MAG: dihydrodipicolinate synthase family protein [Actinobacteria bacterium]|nr:dihydrodipicolinate synthase family protein [Actinomycetota bacterium]MDA2981589.1 dihydrodipicolinate synthase family protein [Actinomycetota bacterium]MDA2996545.1 dihydrodipicolinate synthase family protein [Actinomycetota bacterium]
MNEISGVLPVLAVPFNKDGSLDLDSIPKLVEHCINNKANGVVIFGLASELYKINDSERIQILEKVISSVNSRVPVIVGTEHSGTLAAVARSIEAEKFGASALMLYPPTFIKPDEANVLSYFKEVGSAVKIPIIIQDAPAWTGVPLPVSLLSRIIKEQPNVCYIKLESPPIGDKAKLLKSEGFKIIAGYGAIHLMEDLTAGIDGFMPGCSLPGIFVEINDLFKSGNIEKARTLYQLVLPLLTFQLTSLDTFIEIQKLLLKHLQIFSTSYCREPHIPISSERIDYLNLLLAEIGLKELEGVRV